nr:MAG TPA: hypothetical protein [Caudoviricetes sp.]
MLYVPPPCPQFGRLRYYCYTNSALCKNDG